MTIGKKEDVQNRVRLVVADVDGTLVTPDKIVVRSRQIIASISSERST
jgi:hydroxymethylpyrimidine pyrophosphatase-like HAD family hydrolase